MTAPSLAKRLFLILVSTALALLVAEVGVRLYFGVADENPGDLKKQLERSRRASLGEKHGAFSLMGLVQPSAFDDIIYELKPNVSGTFREQPVRTNSHGLRGPEVSIEKPPGVFRIVGIGDSQMFGWGVGQEEMYLRLLERRLDAAAGGKPRFEVLNFGVPGYNTFMEVATFEHKVLDYAPDLVILHFVGNDFELPHFMQPPKAAGPLPRSYLWDFLKVRFGPPDPDPDPELLHDLHQLPDDARHETQGRYARMVGEGAFVRAMGRLAQLTSMLRVPVVVLTLGDGVESRPIVRQTAESHGFHVVNAASVLSEYLVGQRLDPEDHALRVRTFRIPHDGHPNVLAHGLLAEALWRQLVAMKVAPAGAVPGAVPARP